MHPQCGCTALTILLLWGERWQVWQKISCLLICMTAFRSCCLRTCQLRLSSIFCLAAPAYKAERITATIDLWPTLFLMVMLLDSSLCRHRIQQTLIYMHCRESSFHQQAAKHYACAVAPHARCPCGSRVALQVSILTQQHSGHPLVSCRSSMQLPQLH